MYKRQPKRSVYGVSCLFLAPFRLVFATLELFYIIDQGTVTIKGWSWVRKSINMHEIMAVAVAVLQASREQPWKEHVYCASNCDEVLRGAK